MYLYKQQVYLKNGADKKLLNEASKAIELMQKKQLMTSGKKDMQGKMTLKRPST